ncbi:MAG: DUF4199 domain-containing protein [Bacteroidales bacterium]|nr:DUF4199 domain-containing protein [Bacteroidales bacterium]HNW74162.1 DUF4199 domain-containing protein [Bacteroidales bacterium]HPS51232.1 DUF4199 domain-containing protein [Bacteroidales bacterium]
MKTSFPMILKNGWIYGLILAAISIVFSLLMYIFNVNMFTISFGIISFLVFVVAIPVTIGILGGNSLRLKFAPERQISYLDAVLSCLVIFLIGFLLSNLYSYIFNNFIDPEFMKQQVAKMTEMLQNYNLPQEKIDESIAKVEASNNIGKQILNSLIISAVLSLLVGLVIRKKDKVEEKMI